MIKASTKLLLKNHGWRIDRSIHNYIYFAFYYPYVKFTYHLLSLLTARLLWFKSAGFILKTAFNRYHAKVLTFADAEKIFKLNEDVSATSPKNRQIIPFKYAYKIIFSNPQNIAVMDCPCKKTHGYKGGDINSCIGVGRSVSSFWLEHGKKYNAHKISGNEALDIIKKLRGTGHITQAFFKVATGGFTGVICSCRPDTCVSLQATVIAKKFNDKLSMNIPSGYSVRLPEAACSFCGRCGGICPVKSIRASAEQQMIEYDFDTCLGCGLCIEHCPENALSLQPDSSKPRPLDLDIVKKEYVTERD